MNKWTIDVWFDGYRWAAFEAQAKADGQSLSEWAGKCMRGNLSKDVAAGLSERPAANRPRKPNQRQMEVA